MDSKDQLQLESFELGKRMIDSALRLDDSLVDLLKVEILRLKKLNKINGDLEDLSKTNQLIKNIIYTITLNSEKIANGINLCKTIEKEIEGDIS